MLQAAVIGADERMRPKLDGKSENGRSERVQIVAPRSWIDNVEDWRATQRPVPNLSAAIRRLVEIGLETEVREGGKISKV